MPAMVSEAWPARLRQIIQQRLGLSQIECVEALSEPVIYGRKQIASLGSPALIVSKPRLDPLPR